MAAATLAVVMAALDSKVRASFSGLHFSETVPSSFIPKAVLDIGGQRAGAELVHGRAARVAPERLGFRGERALPPAGAIGHRIAAGAAR